METTFTEQNASYETLGVSIIQWRIRPNTEESKEWQQNMPTYVPQCFSSLGLQTVMRFMVVMTHSSGNYPKKN